MFPAQFFLFYWNLHSELEFFILSLFFGIIAFFGHISNENECKKLILSQFFIKQKVPKKLKNQRKSTFQLLRVQASHFGETWADAGRGIQLFLALNQSQNHQFPYSILYIVEKTYPPNMHKKTKNFKFPLLILNKCPKTLPKIPSNSNLGFRKAKRHTTWWT